MMGRLFSSVLALVLLVAGSQLSAQEEWVSMFNGRTLEGWTQKNGCLLYTSPSPRDRTRSRMPSSA